MARQKIPPSTAQNAGVFQFIEMENAMADNAGAAKSASMFGNRPQSAASAG